MTAKMIEISLHRLSGDEEGWEAATCGQHPGLDSIATDDTQQGAIDYLAEKLGVDATELRVVFSE